MSRGTVVARRYAKALFELAQEQGKTEETESQLQALAQAYEQDAEIRAFLSAPGIAAADKIKALQAGFGGAASTIVLNTIGLLIERGRHGEIAALLAAYRQVAGRELGQADAIVSSARPLADDEKARLAAQFGLLIGKKVRVDNLVDAGLLGGLTVRIGDTLYDGSLRGKLDRLSKQLQASV